MPAKSQRSVKRHTSKGPQQAPAKEPRRAPARGKPGKPKGAESTIARRTGRSAAATRAHTNNAPRKK
ncbi:MAG TPA: hypothetical protein VHG27_09045 [Xanthobacteraceae bacterium]|nr:hypothetical protein [Xanthobacteraceae bacterium]